MIIPLIGLENKELQFSSIVMNLLDLSEEQYILKGKMEI